MRQIAHLIIFKVLCVSLFYSCTSKRAVSPAAFKSSFTKSIFREDSFWLNIKLKNDSLLRLSSIENGTDSFVFRFWVDQQLIEGEHMFELKFVNNQWVNTHYFFISDIREPESKKFYAKWLGRKLEKDSLVASHNLEIAPEKFLTVFKNNNLFELPTQISLKGYSGCCVDGVVYYYEVATKNSYRFVVYGNPQCCKDKNRENRIFLSFLEEFKYLLKPCEFHWPMCKIDSAAKNKKAVP